MSESPEVLLCRRTLIYDRRAPADALLADLAQVQAYDKLVEFGRRYWRNWFWGALVLGILCIPATILTEGGAAPATVPIGGAMVVLGIWSLVRWRWLAAGDVDDARYQTAERLVRLTARDTAPDSPMRLKLDLRSVKHKSKHLRKGESGLWTVHYYRDPWLTAEGRLLDGVAYRLELTTLHQARSRWKRNARGKSKLKTKHKTAGVASLTLKVKPERHPHLPTLGKAAQQRLAFPDRARVKRLEFAEDQIRCALQASGEPSLDTAVDIWKTLYVVVRQSRKLGKSQS